MANEILGGYTQEDVRQIAAAGNEGFVFRGPEGQDPLGQLLSDVQSLDRSSLPMGEADPKESSQVLIFGENDIPQGAVVEL